MSDNNEELDALNDSAENSAESAVQGPVKPGSGNPLEKVMTAAVDASGPVNPSSGN